MWAYANKTANSSTVFCYCSATNKTKIAEWWSLSPLMMPQFGSTFMTSSFPSMEPNRSSSLSLMMIILHHKRFFVIFVKQLSPISHFLMPVPSGIDSEALCLACMGSFWFIKSIQHLVFLTYVAQKYTLKSSPTHPQQ